VICQTPQSKQQWTFLAQILTNIIKPKHDRSRRWWQTATRFVSPAASGVVLFLFNRSQTSRSFCIHFAKLCADDCFKQPHFIITDELWKAFKKLWTAGALRHNNRTYNCRQRLCKKLPNDMQHKAVYLLFCKLNLHVSDVNHTHHQEYTKL